MALEPGVGRSVLVQQHARQGPARPLPAMRPTARRRPDQTGRMQMGLGPGIAPAKTMVLAQVIVEMLDRPARVNRTVLLHHPVDLVDRHTLGRGLAKAPVKQAIQTLILMAAPPTPKRPLAHPQDLRRLKLAQLPLPHTIQNTLELLHSKLL